MVLNGTTTEEQAAMETNDEIRRGAAFHGEVRSVNVRRNGVVVHGSVWYHSRRFASIAVLEDHNGWRRPSWRKNLVGWGTVARLLNEGGTYEFIEQEN